MSRQPSTFRNSSQQESTLRSDISARLREERHRIEPTQGRFAERIGLKQGKYSHLETGLREAKAEDLAAIAAAGVDIHYVLTGKRISAELLDADTAAAMNDFMALPAHLRQIARSVLRTMVDESEGPLGGSRPVRPPSATVHEKKSATATTNRQ